MEEQQATWTQHSAAILIQKAWRRSKLAKEHMYTQQRWHDVAVRARLKIEREAANNGHNSPKERWHRAAFLASRLQDPHSLPGPMVEDDDAPGKQLDTQHWLELVDARHRYGANLKWYHKRWQASDTSDNFFKWLDRGEGKTLSLDECSREQLEKERIMYVKFRCRNALNLKHQAMRSYLSTEQRLNYLIKIDQAGKLRWARNDEYVDTTANLWKDSGDGAGIIRIDSPLPTPLPRQRSFLTTPSEEDENAATHYVGTSTKGRYTWTKAIRRRVTPHGIMDRLLRKTVQKNTWMYVSDKNYNVFIGIKSTGAFQHSSFLSGGLVSSAGLISVQEGMIMSLSPLSGHYRTSIDHFHRFIDAMKERGADLHNAKISKAEAVLWIIEHISKWKKKQNKVYNSGKGDVKMVFHKVAEVVKETERIHWKREVLEGRRSKS